MGEVIQFPRRPITEPTLTKAQIASSMMLRGRRCSVRTVERWIQAGMPCSLIDGQRKAKLSDVLAWLDQQEGGDAA